ncbi:MAG TPA: hypothetical protein VF553_12185 [Pyrinomonadaceae bacterium]|jgi:hypothetical protein
MHTSRINNASLFVTVLSACLGLVMTGVPAHAHTQPGIGVAVERSQALVAGTTSQQLSPQQARKLAAAANSYFQIAACHIRLEPAEVFYHNTLALSGTDQLLVVTRLPRAGLPALLAEQQRATI